MQDGRIAAELADELPHEARLADPGRTREREQVAGAAVRDAREDVAERVELVLAADERRVEAAGRSALPGRGSPGSGRWSADDAFLHHPSRRMGALRRPGCTHARTHPTLAHPALHRSAG